MDIEKMWIKFLMVVTLCVTAFLICITVTRHLDKRAFIASGYVEAPRVGPGTYWVKL